MDDQETLALPVAVSAPAEIDAGDVAQLRPVLCAGDRELRSAVLTVALSRSRLRAGELRAQYASVVRKVTATGDDTAAVTSRWAERWPHRAERLGAVGAAAAEAAGEWRRAADGQGRGAVTIVDPGAPGPARIGVKNVEVMRLESESQAQRLGEAMACLRTTLAEIEQSRPHREMLRHSAFARIRARLDTLPVIEQAKGIIMAQQQCGPDEAFDLLPRTSQRMNVSVRHLAAQIGATTSGGPVKRHSLG